MPTMKRKTAHPIDDQRYHAALRQTADHKAALPALRQSLRKTFDNLMSKAEAVFAAEGRYATDYVNYLAVASEPMRRGAVAAADEHSRKVGLGGPNGESNRERLLRAGQDQAEQILRGRFVEQHREEARQLANGFASALQGAADALAKAEAAERLPPALSLQDDPTRTVAALTQTSALREQLEVLRPREALQAWKDTLTLENDARTKMFINAAKPVIRPIVEDPRKYGLDHPNWKPDAVQRETTAARQLYYEMERWEEAHMPEDLAVARDMLEGMTRVFKLLCGLHVDFLTKPQRMRLYSDPSVILDQPFKVYETKTDSWMSRFLPMVEWPKP